jgi:mannose-6-phosphate isomerase-like protein (cupin superfamily)
VTTALPFDVQEVSGRLFVAGGGYEIVHESPGLEIGVYALVAPDPDRQEPHEDDEIYLVLDGSGVLDVEGERRELAEGDGIFVPARAHHRFTDYDRLSLLVVFARGAKP